MQGLEKHNLSRITDAPAAFLIQLQKNFVRAFLVECSFDTHCLQNSEIPTVFGLPGGTLTSFIRGVWPPRGGGGNFHRLGYGMCHFLGVLFWLKNKFLGLFYSL